MHIHLCQTRRLAESAGVEPARPEGLVALAPRCLAARPTLRIEAGPHDRTRTCILDIRNVVLIRLSYVGTGASDGIRTRVAALRAESCPARRQRHARLRRVGSRRRIRTCLRRLTAGSPHRDGSTGIFVAEFGGTSRNRTDDILLAKQALSLLSYGPEMVHKDGIEPPTRAPSTRRSTAELLVRAAAANLVGRDGFEPPQNERRFYGALGSPVPSLPGLIGGEVRS